MIFFYVLLFLSLFSSNGFAAPIQELILKKLSISLPDNNTRSISNSLDLCSISVTNSLYGFTLNIKKSYQGEHCQANYGATFEFRAESDCKMERNGTKQEITCTWSDCETQGCTERSSKLTIEGNVFRVGNVKCDLGRKSRTGQGDINCHP